MVVTKWILDFGSQLLSFGFHGHDLGYQKVQTPVTSPGLNLESQLLTSLWLWDSQSNVLGRNKFNVGSQSQSFTVFWMPPRPSEIQKTTFGGLCFWCYSHRLPPQKLVLFAARITHTQKIVLFPVWLSLPARACNVFCSSLMALAV